MFGMALVMSGSALAGDGFSSGLYLGIQGGKSYLHYSGPDYLLSTNSIDDHKFAGRAFVGYHFTEFLATEIGYGYYGAPKIKYNATGEEQSFSQQGADIFAKVVAPLDYGINFFGKLGASFLYRSAVKNRDGHFVEKIANRKIAPAVGLGVGYAFNMNWVADLSWMRTFSNGTLPKMDFLAVGIVYRFAN